MRFRQERANRMKYCNNIPIECPKHTKDLKIIPFRLAIVLVLLATPALAQEPMDTIAEGLSVSAPDMLMRAALANCIAYGTAGAISQISAAGWQSDTDDGGLTTLWLDETYAMINPTEGLCIVSNAVVPMQDAAIVAGDLLTTLYGGAVITETDELGCILIASDAEPADYIALSSDGNDPTCEDTGQGGSALTYYTE